MKTEDRRNNTLQQFNSFKNRASYIREKEKKEKKSIGEFNIEPYCDISSSNICISNLL